MISLHISPQNGRLFVVKVHSKAESPKANG